LILADEPTGNLDTENGRRVVEVLRRLVDELQQTVVVVTHDLSVAESADRVLLLRDGQIASDLAGRDCTRDTVSAALASPFGVRP
jgi:putative ABC transport system ATP-binding protein